MLFCKPGRACGRRGWRGTLSAGHPNTMATSLIMFSTISRPWGTPKPLKAVFDGRLVLHAVLRPRRLGMLYAVSMWRTIFPAICKHHKIHSYVLWRFTFISSSISFFHLPMETHLQCCHCWQRTGNLQQQSSHHSWNPPETNGSQQVNNAFKTKKFKDLLVTTFQNWRWNPLKPTFVNHQKSKKCKTTLYKKNTGATSQPPSRYTYGIDLKLLHRFFELLESQT